MSQSPPDTIRSVPGLLVWWSEHFPERDALYHKAQGWWKPITWRKYLEKVDAVAERLLLMGVSQGDRIAILSTTRVEWTIADMAIMSCGAITVPIYQSNTSVQCKYIIHHSGCTGIFHEDQEQLDKLLEFWGQVPQMRIAIVFEKFQCEDERVVPFQNLFADKNGPVSEFKVSSARNKIQSDDPATLVYTSGTTGPPKGVVLSHNNILFTARQITTSLDLSPDDLSLAYLPMAHIAERIVASFMKLASGARTAFAEGMDDLIFNMKEVGPSFHFGTPRVYEKFHARTMTAIDDATSFQKIIYRWAENVGSCEKDLRLSHQPIPWWLHVRYILANWLVFRKVRGFMGGNLRFLISGGAPISLAILEWMQSVGLNVLEVYGMTESTGLISVNFIEDNRLGSVGKALPDTKMRIAEDGEILSQGENICLGYFADNEAIAELIDESGWLHSGDIGRIDEDGYLWITDRKKDLIITAGGKNVAPQNIENLMKTSKFISQFMVFGDRRKYLTGLLTLDEDETTKFARDQQLIYSDQKELSQLSEVTELITGEIERLNKQLASFETIKKFCILEDELSQDNEEVTPTLKVKRAVIEKRYGHLIEGMYGG